MTNIEARRRRPMYNVLRRARTVVAACLVIATTLAISGCNAAKGPRMTFMLDTNILPKHGIFFAAATQGFYEEADLNIEIIPGTGSQDTAKAVGTGRAQFGFADFGASASVRAGGADVKQLAVIHAESPFAVVTTADSDIRSWKDLKGKTVAGEPGGSTTVLFPVVEKMAGLKKGDVKVVHAAGTAKVPGLLAGKWDATLAYFVSDPPVLLSEGVTPRSLKWSDVGFELYSNGLVTSDKMIRKDPDAVKRFVQATSEGVKWACDNQKDAAQALTEEVGEIDMKGARAGIQAACEILWIPETEKNGLGYMTRDGVENVLKITEDYLGLKGDKLSPGSLYTNKFNSGIKKNQKISAPS